MTSTYCVCLNSRCSVEPKVFSNPIDTLKHFPNQCQIVTFDEIYQNLNNRQLCEIRLDEKMQQANDMLVQIAQTFKDLMIQFTQKVQNSVQQSYQQVIRQNELLNAVKNMDMAFLVKENADLSTLMDQSKLDEQLKFAQASFDQVEQDIKGVEKRLIQSFSADIPLKQQEPINNSFLQDSSLCTTEKQAILIKDWIGIKNCGSKLIYLGSEDGFDTQTFFEKCVGKAQTLVLVKSKEGQKIFGGFTRKLWEQAQGWFCQKDEDAFVFSLTHSTKHELYQNYDNAVCMYSSAAENWAPCFGGHGQWIYDIIISDQCNTNAMSQSDLGYCYKPPVGIQFGSPLARSYLAGSHKFTVEEIEVHQIQNL